MLMPACTVGCAFLLRYHGVEDCIDEEHLKRIESISDDDDGLISQHRSDQWSDQAGNVCQTGGSIGQKKALLLARARQTVRRLLFAEGDRDNTPLSLATL